LQNKSHEIDWLEFIFGVLARLLLTIAWLLQTFCRTFVTCCKINLMKSIGWNSSLEFLRDFCQTHAWLLQNLYWYVRVWGFVMCWMLRWRTNINCTLNLRAMFIVRHWDSNWMYKCMCETRDIYITFISNHSTVEIIFQFYIPYRSCFTLNF